MHSRSLSDLCCLTQAAILNFCLDDQDLHGLDRSHDGRSPRGFSLAVRSRARLHRALQEERDVARAVSDLLDVRYLDDVVLARSSESEELEAQVNDWVESPDGTRLPGLMWALATDARASVHALGARLGHEAAVAASRAFTRVESAPSARP